MESLLEDAGHCGRFHVMAVNVVYLSKIHLAFSMLFMSFGIYNPGWRCGDSIILNATDVALASSTTASTDSLTSSINSNSSESEQFVYNEESCQVYVSCKDIQFNPDSSTVITEWGLVCDQAWIASLIISIQMAGTLVGSFFTGYLGDRFGRKYTLLACLLLHAVFNLIIIFSVSWSMFAVCKFFIGIVVAFFRFLPFVYISEFVPPKWRGAVACYPMYATAAILFAVVCMVTKDWRQIHIVFTIFSVAAFLALLWMPRSVRWLAVHGEEKEAHTVVARIAKMNGKEVPDRTRISEIISKYNDQTTDSKTYRMIDLFRKGFRMSAAIIAYLFLIIAMSYFAISYGVKSLPGNLYTNMIILYSTEYIANAYTSLASNTLGRRVSLITSLVGSTACLLGVVVFDRLALGNAKDLGVLISAMAVCVFNNIAWFVLTAYMSELYPTVIRSTITGWGSLNAQIGAIVAPYFIPNTPDYLYICYLIMGCLNVLSCFLFFFLEDTSNKPLADTWASGSPSEGKTKDADRVPLNDVNDVASLDDKKEKNVII